MSDVTARYETLHDFILFLGTFMHYNRDRRSSLMYVVLYLHQIVMDCVSSQYTYFDM